jgi:hypothetical protein
VAGISIHRSTAAQTTNKLEIPVLAVLIDKE